tara:strand:- start:794 stop:2296 length:1503 start_codon:yes stop_codon:yes gene_type:complete
MCSLIRIYFYYIIIFSSLFARLYIPADPYYLIYYEYQNYHNGINQKSLLFRPIIENRNFSGFNIILRNEVFLNNNNPNLENMGNKWVGRGIGFFTGYSISYHNNFVSFSIEPFYYINQNKYTENIHRVYPYDSSPDIFNVLNDNRYFSDEPYKTYGIRESHLFFHYKEIGFGISNANMWWGPGIHTSLAMTNNTLGFPYLMIGTIDEKRFDNIGFNFRYYFSKLNKIYGDPYFTALLFSTTFYNDPIITIGFSRNFLSGGVSTDRPFTVLDAALLPFDLLFIDSKIKKYSSEWDAHDPWDQILTGYLSLNFKESGLKLFLELGTDDHRQNFIDLRSQPDHNSAAIIGLRKYGMFNKDNIFGGIEYANIKQSYTNKFRGGGLWWFKDYYNYHSINGRRWTAHSGSDSDDFYLFLGFLKNDLIVIPGFNYERHGIINGTLPEVKIEFRLDIRFVYNDLNFNIFVENELVNNLGFVENNKIDNSVIWFGIEKNLNSFTSSLLN